MCIQKGHRPEHTDNYLRRCAISRPDETSRKLRQPCKYSALEANQPATCRRYATPCRAAPVLGIMGENDDNEGLPKHVVNSSYPL